MPTALLIDDQPESLLRLGEVIRDSGFTVDTAEDLETARRSLAESLPEVAILNLQVAEDGGERDALQLFAERDLARVVELYLVTDDPSVESARRGMRIGASDYYQRPVDLDRLKENLVELREELERGEASTDATEGASLGLLNGRSPAMQRVFRMVRRAAPTPVTVFISGESGTGKELVARTIHELSDRGDEAFIAVNCGALSGELIESELFGHRKGAFTGAHRGHRGFFQQADGGTLFLDEVTEMSKKLQVRLLRALESGTARRVGGEREYHFDVRILASTNRDPEEAVANGVLREDLFYRLAEFPIAMPALRERGDDVLLLARLFLADLNERSARTRTLSEEVEELLRLHQWPGNIRELRNVMRRAFILSDDEIRADDLPAQIPSGGEVTGDAIRVAIGQSLEDVERRVILATLDHCDGNKREASEILGISLKTLYNRLKKYRQN